MKILAPLLLLTLSVSAFANLPAEHACNEFDAKKARAQRAVDDYLRDAQRAENMLRFAERDYNEAVTLLNDLSTRAQALRAEVAALEKQRDSLRPQQQRRVTITNLLVTMEKERRSFNERAMREPNFNLKQPLLREAKRIEKEMEGLRTEAAQLDQALNRLNNLNRVIEEKELEAAQAQRNLTRGTGVDPTALRQSFDRARENFDRNYNETVRQSLDSELNRAIFHVEMCYGYIDLSLKYPVALETARRVNQEGCRTVRPMNYIEPAQMQAQAEVIQKMCSR